MQVLFSDFSNGLGNEAMHSFVHEKLLVRIVDSF